MIYYLLVFVSLTLFIERKSVFDWIDLNFEGCVLTIFCLNFGYWLPLLCIKRLAQIYELRTLDGLNMGGWAPFAKTADEVVILIMDFYSVIWTDVSIRVFALYFFLLVRHLGLRFWVNGLRHFCKTDEKKHMNFAWLVSLCPLVFFFRVGFKLHINHLIPSKIKVGTFISKSSSILLFFLW